MIQSAILLDYSNYWLLFVSYYVSSDKESLSSSLRLTDIFVTQELFNDPLRSDVRLFSKKIELFFTFLPAKLMLFGWFVLLVIHIFFVNFFSKNASLHMTDKTLKIHLWERKKNVNVSISVLASLIMFEASWCISTKREPFSNITVIFILLIWVEFDGWSK